MPKNGDPQLSARLQALFADELDDQVGRLASGLEALAAAQPDIPVEIVTELFRSAHSLKGAAQAAGIPAIASLCHDLEEELVRLRDGERKFDATTMAKLHRLVDGVADQRSQPVRYEPSAAPNLEPLETEPASASRGGWTLTGNVGTGAAHTSAPLHELGPQRVTGHKIDDLSERAGDLITISYGSQAFIDRLTEVEDRLRGDEAQRRHERETILSLLAGHQLRGRIAALLEQGEKRGRGAVHLLDEVLAAVSAQQKSLRASAAGFAEAARKARMVPFEHATSGLRRQVRELSAELGKEADLEILATDVEVDKELVLMLREALGHLIRNALDHGLEPPADRTRAGKDPRGKIRVEASLGNDGIHVQVSDDGRGVDESRLREAASRRDMVRPDGANLSLAEAMFAPGVSTAQTVTSVSGRGVGLDAVRAAVESTGGSVTVQSEPGAGTTLTLLLPLNLSTMRALLLRTGDQIVCLPSASARRLVSLPDRGRRLGSGAVVTIDDEVIPTAMLSDILGWKRDSGDASTGRTGLLALSDAGLAVLAVDEVIAEREIVLRTSPRRLAGVREILGTAQLDDGSLVLVLNPQVCLRAVVLNASVTVTDTPGETTRGHSVLLVEDSLTTRELERSLLEAAGHSVLVAHDGQQAWEMLQANDVDAVVSDVNMPRMDGIALCRAIRSSSRLASLPVVLVTSLHSDADRRAGLDAGADAYLTKVGFNRDELIEALERLL